MPHEFPLPEGRPPPVLNQAPTPDRPLSGLTVLVVEDSRFACEALRLLCNRLGARMRRAETLEAAGAHLRLYRPDVVMVDIGLPDGPGTTLIAGLARTGPARPLILGMSGEDGGETLARSAGAAGYVAKPLESLSAFRNLVVSLLPERRWLGALPAPAAVLPAPDPLALRDDLARAAARLAEAPFAVDAYLAGFVTGLARATHDPTLERAARGPVAQLAPVLEHRLAAFPSGQAFDMT